MSQQTRRVWYRGAVAASALLFAACPGPAGQPCSVTDNGNGTVTVACPDGSAATVASGAKGSSCTVTTDTATGVKTISCTDGTTATVSNGTSCTVSTDTTTGVKTISCADGTTATVSDGTNGIDGASCTLSADGGVKTINCGDGGTFTVVDGKDANALVDFPTLTAAEIAGLDLRVIVLGITDENRPVVTFTVRDAKGRGVKAIPPANFSGIALLQLVPGNTASGGNGRADDTWVSHISNCDTCTASTETATATSLTDLGDGTYRYTFSKDVKATSPVPGVLFDGTAVHRFGLRLASTGNPFRPVDAVYDYVPATGADVTGQTDKVSTTNCLDCHMQWRANANNAGGRVPFHSGQRYEARYCHVCHNDQRKYSGNAATGNAVYAEPTIDALGNMTLPALSDGGVDRVRVVRGEAVINMPVWVHKIHRGKELFLKGNYAGLGAELNSVAFPQDLRNCTKCHRNAPQADNWKTKPNRRACGACHDDVDFTTGTNHTGGAQADDANCATCHAATAVADKHIPVALPNPNNAFQTPGGSSNTHASWVGNASNKPAGASVITYEMPVGAVTTVAAASGTGVNAQVRFRLMKDGTAVVFNTYQAGVVDELITGFVGAPSIYCAFAVPQDGIAQPADFNATASGYLRSIWRGTATGTGAGTLVGPDASGYYTATLTGVAIPPTATMLTCGVGYSYNLVSSPPLTQTDLLAYPATTMADGGVIGGLAIPPANIWQVAVGYTGRRGATNSSATAGTIVSTAKCNVCHEKLGVSPTYHSGQRNDGPTCSFCHTQNRNSSGWSAGSESYIHAIHSADKRTVPFNWHAISATEGFYEIKFPGRPQMCEGCHNPGYYDFSNAWYTPDNMSRRLVQTVGTGTYNTTLADGGVSTLAWSISPYVVSDGGVSYGSGYSFNGTTGAVTEAAATTLANSPISNVCFGCHDSAVATAHMATNGGLLYTPRSQVKATVEQCLVCHGPGKVAAIKDVHYQ